MHTTSSATKDRSPRRDRHRSRWAAVGAAIAVSLGAGGGLGLVQAAVESGDKPVYIPIEPCRLADTRPGDQVGAFDTKIGPDETRTLDAHGTNGDCTIPGDALAIAANVTGLNATANSFFTLFPQDAAALPLAANLNLRPGTAPTPNLANVTLAANGQFNLYNAFGEADFVIDVAGYFVDHHHDDRYSVRSAADATDALIEIPAEPIDVATITIDTPLPGQVVVNSTIQVSETTSGETVICSISDTSATQDDGAQQRWQAAGDGGTIGQLSGTRAFDVDGSSDTFTVHLVCDHGGGGAAAFSQGTDPSLTGIFVPTP